MKNKYIIGLGIFAISIFTVACGSSNNTDAVEVMAKGTYEETLQEEQTAVSIETAEPISINLGEEEPPDWIQLASLSDNPAIRNEWDRLLNIIPTDTGKNGMLYINEAGGNENNNTLRAALHNRAFQKALEDITTSRSLAEAVTKNYADIEASEADISTALYMGINGYFNLLPDSTPSYANPDATLQRNEFMSMVYRSETPVQDISTDYNFEYAVGQSEYNIYAQGLSQDSYLDITSKSLNEKTYNGTITRAEAIYLLVSHYYNNDLASYTGNSTVTFSDAKDGGDIASKKKIDRTSDYWKSYELTYAIQNPEDGLPTDLYKALQIAYQKGIITTQETRWDEGLTRAEAMELLVNTLKNESSMAQYNSAMGAYTSISDSGIYIGTDGEPTFTYTVTSYNAIMTVKEDGFSHTGPDEGYSYYGELTAGREVEIVGKVDDMPWYQMKATDGLCYVHEDWVEEKQEEQSEIEETEKKEEVQQTLETKVEKQTEQSQVGQTEQQPSTTEQQPATQQQTVTPSNDVSVTGVDPNTGAIVDPYQHAAYAVQDAQSRGWQYLGNDEWLMPEYGFTTGIMGSKVILGY